MVTVTIKILLCRRKLTSAALFFNPRAKRLVRYLHLFAKPLVTEFPEIKPFKNEADKTVTIVNSPIEISHKRVGVVQTETQHLFA